MNKKISANDFLEWTKTPRIGPEIEYILDFRSIDGRNQYLVRYKDKNKYKFDIWEDNVNVLDEQKVTAFWSKENPELTPNLDPNDEDQQNEENEEENPEQIQQKKKENAMEIAQSLPSNAFPQQEEIQPSKNLRILSQKIINQQLFFEVILPGKTETTTMMFDQMQKEFPEESKEYYEKFLSNALFQKIIK